MDTNNIRVPGPESGDSGPLLAGVLTTVKYRRSNPEQTSHILQHASSCVLWRTMAPSIISQQKALIPLSPSSKGRHISPPSFDYHIISYNDTNGNAMKMDLIVKYMISKTMQLRV